MDNYAVHKTPQAKAWLVDNPGFHVHFPPLQGRGGSGVHALVLVGAEDGTVPCPVK